MVELHTLVSEVVEDARLEATATNKQVQCECTASIDIEGDQRLLRSAIENVLRNAIRFTAPGTSVRVELTREASNARISIEDSGPGVPESELQLIFEPFYRVAESRDRDSGGTGLGLAITSRIRSGVVITSSPHHFITPSPCPFVARCASAWLRSNCARVRACEISLSGACPVPLCALVSTPCRLNSSVNGSASSNAVPS